MKNTEQITAAYRLAESVNRRCLDHLRRDEWADRPIIVRLNLRREVPKVLAAIEALDAAGVTTGLIREVMDRAAAEWVPALAAAEAAA